ncbi:hypothetical protein RI578_40955 (plasmid) [Streptomyces sp. BB1-1-1]|uniref:hypothetical protein n=1 Tax=Streptomyces sp. BB1-1-1 TaxID=3074430 RepID=UPI002877DD17|nr:hypothetical protein [Streptomyces sp. BB1-1-1]WND40663.1 hypothetical protein RI578_40955 [Streptomyces sp. BB1-1-1]
MTRLINTGSYARQLLSHRARVVIGDALVALEHNFHEAISWGSLPVTWMQIRLPHPEMIGPQPDQPDSQAVAVEELDVPGWAHDGGPKFQSAMEKYGQALLDDSAGLGPDSRTDPMGPVVGLLALAERWSLEPGGVIEGVDIEDTPGARRQRSLTAVLADGTVLAVTRTAGVATTHRAQNHISRIAQGRTLAPALWLMGQGTGVFPLEMPPPGERV